MGRLAGVESVGPASGSVPAQTALRFVGEPEPRAQRRELWLGLHVLEFRAAELTLERLATSTQHFTPRTSLVYPDGLLLEVKGSLHLFNGLEGLVSRVSSECRRLGAAIFAAAAPTPLAALVAARVGSPLRIVDDAQLVGSLSAVPLAPLRWPQEVVERLARMGVRTIGQALRLPRVGFARRFGTQPLSDLDRLVGRCADPRPGFRPRERFRRRRELTHELVDIQRILGAMTPLLEQLGRFLRDWQCGVTELECRFRHRHSPESCCTLSLSSPISDVDSLTALLRERLNTLRLPEPVRSLEIRSGFPVPRVLESGSVWHAGEYGGARGAESPELIERLRARLGPESVYGVVVRPGHRPEHAWRRQEPSANTDSPHPPWPAFRRPVWLLPEPRQLEEIDGLPVRNGTLRLAGDIERIETGWWEQGGVARDYYRAYDNSGTLLWVFRERSEPHRWFLHGVFG
jgi:protein ImuB